MLLLCDVHADLTVPQAMCPEECSHSFFTLPAVISSNLHTSELIHNE